MALKPARNPVQGRAGAGAHRFALEEAREVVGQCGGVAVPADHRLFKRLQADALQRFGNRFVDIAGQRRLLVQNLLYDGGDDGSLY